MRIGILSSESDQEATAENNRLVREIRITGHESRIINFQEAVVAITDKGRMLCQFDKGGSLRPIKVHVVIPRINEAEEQAINLGTLSLQALISNGAYSMAKPQAIKLAKNKLSSLIALNAAGVPTPRSAAITGTETYPLDKVLKIVEPDSKKRLIVKTNIGTHGRGVMSAKSRGDARAIVEGFLANNIPVLVQEFIEPEVSDTYIDIRLIVVGGKVIAAMKRESAGKDEIRANLALGGKGFPYTPSLSERQLAVRAARAVGLHEAAGVDIIPTANGPVVIEVNSSPGFGVESVTDVNVVAAIVELAVSKGQRRKVSAPLKKVSKRAIRHLNLKPQLNS